MALGRCLGRPLPPSIRDNVTDSDLQLTVEVDDGSDLNILSSHVAKVLLEEVIGFKVSIYSARDAAGAGRPEISTSTCRVWNRGASIAPHASSPATATLWTASDQPPAVSQSGRGGAAARALSIIRPQSGAGSGLASRSLDTFA